MSEGCEPPSGLNFETSNRLLTDGPWTDLLLHDPAAWPLWAFGRHVGADAIVEQIAAVEPEVRYGG